ncbi:mucosa-associated lymphoid tissue lymphoma translocation protein 1-like isoform X1 [Ceratina calcarata]|uniref:Mucosa-associated lymphoid tissue lymphoma translocation protein 1-like isoform X1 n=1 Tax=Ceratina calcarata TaxID=156304 RepID=A0AAJ7N608_9HYME|nr:mucosa-associated lymphoid tissue lymphoma translocation protein 1-like isoform X1 [Ceratina calcarata]
MHDCSCHFFFVRHAHAIYEDQKLLFLRYETSYPDTYVERLPVSTYKELVDALNKDETWITLANHVAEKLEYPCSNSWIRHLKEKTNSNDSPGQRLLTELNIKLCTVEILQALLESCALYNVLSIISDPEPLCIILHPTDQSQTDILNIPFGHRLYLCCKATGIPPPTYTWYHRNMQLQHCTFNELDIVITSAAQAGEYKCKVDQIKNDGTLVSSLISKAVIVHVSMVPVEIEEQPLPILEAKEGEDFTIRCKANSYSEANYQWYHGNSKLEGETSDTLHVKQANLKNVGKYYCHVYNDVSEMYTQRAHVLLVHPRMKAVAKLALIIANEKYEHHECLLAPKNDAARISHLLKEIGFQVICLINLTLSQMQNAIRIFGKALIDGVYGLFYFAGHGFKMQENYLLPTDCPKIYLRKDAMSESEILSTLLEDDPKLLIVILDMCQSLPSKESNPEIYREIPVVKEYKNKRNLFQAYSTSSYQPSYEDANLKYGLYAAHLGKYIGEDVTVKDLFEQVAKSIELSFKDKRKNQIPTYTPTFTEPFRLIDDVHERNCPELIKYYTEKLMSFTTQTVEVTFEKLNVSTRVTISPFMETFFNLIEIRVIDLPDEEINFFSTPTSRNNLYQDQDKVCWIHNPQSNKGPLVICVSRNGTPVTATVLDIKNYVSPLLELVGA